MEKYNKSSKYDDLNPRKELEQEIAKDLENALAKRGFTVQHSGTSESHAPANKPDIELFDNTTHINVEITKSRKSAQDREWQSIKDHFQTTKRKHSNKKCYLMFISPETYYRTKDSIMDWNYQHNNVSDQKIIPISFFAFEKITIKLIQTTKENYTKKEILEVFGEFTKFNNDESVFRILAEKLLHDAQLQKMIEAKEEEMRQQTIEKMITGFKKLEKKLRDEHIALSGDAIKTVIYLVFIKLYEEKKEKEGSEQSRLTLESFRKYQKAIRDNETAIHTLFSSIKGDNEIKASRLLTPSDTLESRLNDDFVIEHFIMLFEQYIFFTPKVDGLGAAYEVLGQLSSKDTRAGQFFTPDNVVQFMVKLAELDADDKVFDPACGTARFLTHALADMTEKVKSSRDAATKIKHIKEYQMIGVDDGFTVAKLAKMNMYIHGDGKTNIQDADGLATTEQDNKIDVILTNPPLGDVSYYRTKYNDDFRLKRMEVIPRKNITKEKLKTIENKIVEQKLLLTTAHDDKTRKIRCRLEQLNQQKIELDLIGRSGRSEYVPVGQVMKGGALFLNACKHYLKTTRDPSKRIEWRGGKMLIILDEGILNTQDYSCVREFIMRYFYIKAVISLSKDTFIPVSKTTTKTSIMYAIKKEDPDAIQQEPIFFAHAEKVGMDTRKRICANDLFNGGNDILSAYFNFKDKVLSSYVGLNYEKEKFKNEYELKPRNNILGEDD